MRHSQLKHKELTREEWNIFRILVENPTKTNVEIGEDLNRSQHTVAAHVRNILSKLEIRSRYEMLMYAFRNDLYVFQNAEEKCHQWNV